MKNRSIFGWKVSESRIVSVSELKSGIQDDVVCPCCGDFLVAAHSSKGIASYLRHQSDSDCRLSYETQLHISAKAFIEREKTIPHPYSGGIFDAVDCEMVSVKNVRLEVYRDGRVPDVVCEIGREEYYVEVANSHELPSDKIMEFRRQGRSAIELIVDGLDSSSYLESYENVKVQLTALNPLNPIWDHIEQQAQVSISKERSELLRKIARHRKQVQRITKSIPEQERKAQRIVEQLQSKIAKWKEREAYQRGLHEQIVELVESLKTAVDRLNGEKSALHNELEILSRTIEIKRIESEKMISDARKQIASEYDQIKKELRATVLTELEDEVRSAKRRAHKIIDDAKANEAALINGASHRANEIESQAYLKVEEKISVALARRNLSEITLLELEDKGASLKLEVEDLEQKKARLGKELDKEHLLKAQQNLVKRLSEQEARLEELTAIGDKYVTLINSIAIDLKQVSAADYFKLLPERVQKKVRTNRMILEAQSSIEYEPM